MNMDSNVYNIPTVKVKGLSIPRLLLGTSPFVAAGQFGLKSIRYYNMFVLNPKNITELTFKILKLGVKGIQVLGYKFLCKALKEAIRRFGEEVFIAGTIMPDEPDSFKLLLDLGCKIAFIHAMIVDSQSKHVILDIADFIREHGVKAGFATHTPLVTLKYLLRENVKPDFLMAPLNPIGYMMGNVDSVIKLYERYGVPLIAKKTLAAGRLKPRDSLPFVYKFKFVVSAAIGIASVSEALEVLEVVKKIFG